MSAKYDKEHYTGFYMKLHKKYDADIIKALNDEDNKTRYIKDLIIKDLLSRREHEQHKAIGKCKP